jgi:hypothetical protein
VKYMSLKQSLFNTLQVFKAFMPVMIGLLLLINLLNVCFRDYYTDIFTGNPIFDPLIGTIAGSISFGIPVTSYIVGGELLEDGVSLLAVTAFVMAWTTVGLAMLPLEATFFGKRFAIVRNSINFFFSIIIAILTIYTLKVL